MYVYVYVCKYEKENKHKYNPAFNVTYRSCA